MRHSLLDDARQFGSRYGGGLSNHLPMALLALDRLGASDERLREFAAFYARRLSAKTAEEAALAKKYEDDMRSRGRDAVLRDVVSELTPGLGSAAFHGLIRTAYAVDSGDDVDIPDALTSWVVGYAELGEPEGEPRFDGVAEAFDALHGDERLPKEFPGRMIIGVMVNVAGHPAFADYRRPIRNVTLGDLARAAVSIYLATGDFTALHLVTSCHATRVLQPWLAVRALDYLSLALLAGYASIGRPALDAAPQGDVPRWDELAARAIESNDDHDLKLVYSCRQEEACYGWGLHQRAAALRLTHREA